MKDPFLVCVLISCICLVFFSFSKVPFVAGWIPHCPGPIVATHLPGPASPPCVCSSLIGWKRVLYRGGMTWSSLDGVVMVMSRLFGCWCKSAVTSVGTGSSPSLWRRALPQVLQGHINLSIRDSLVSFSFVLRALRTCLRTPETFL